MANQSALFEFEWPIKARCLSLSGQSKRAFDFFGIY